MKYLQTTIVFASLMSVALCRPYDSVTIDAAYPENQDNYYNDNNYNPATQRPTFVIGEAAGDTSSSSSEEYYPPATNTEDQHYFPCPYASQGYQAYDAQPAAVYRPSSSDYVPQADDYQSNSPSSYYVPQADDYQSNSPSSYYVPQADDYVSGSVSGSVRFPEGCDCVRSKNFNY